MLYKTPARIKAVPENRPKVSAVLLASSRRIRPFNFHQSSIGKVCFEIFMMYMHGQNIFSRM